MTISVQFNILMACSDFHGSIYTDELVYKAG